MHGGVRPFWADSTVCAKQKHICVFPLQQKERPFSFPPIDFFKNDKKKRTSKKEMMHNDEMRRLSQERTTK